MRGLIRVKFNGLNARLVINGLIENGVYLKNLKERSKSVSFEIYEKDEKVLKDICKRYHKKFEIISKNNLVNFIKQLRFCFGFLLSVILIFSFIFSFNLYIYNVNVVVFNNNEFDKEKVELFLKDCGVVAGAKKNDIDTLYLERSIMTYFEDVSACLIKLNGGTLDVRLYPAAIKDEVVKENIYSNFDAIVTKVNICAGNSKLKAGDFVRKGDLLIENDNGASGEIFAKIYFSDYLIYNESQQERVLTGNVVDVKGFKIFGKKIFLGMKNNKYLNYLEENCVYYVSKNNFIPLEFVEVKCKEFVYKDVCISFKEKEIELRDEIYKELLSKLKYDFVDKITNVTYSVIEEGNLTRLDCFIECEVDLASA